MFKRDRSWTPGRPFNDDYADSRTPEQRATDAAEVSRQTADLARRRENDSFRRELIRRLQARRDGDAKLVQFDAIRTPHGFETLVVRGELLVRKDTWEDKRVQELLTRTWKFTAEPVACLDGAVVRLRNPDLQSHRLDDIARMVRREGFTASVNHVTPLGPVAKGLGGPEPSSAHLAPEGGGGVKVAVIDNGIVKKDRSDGWLKVVKRRRDNVDPVNALGNDKFLDFAAGHGSFAAGVVEQVARGAEIEAYKALDSDGLGSEVDVACAMVRAVKDGADVLNLSLGSQTVDDQPPVAIAAALEWIREYERKEGRQVAVVAAAGNFASNRPCWPAAFRRVLSVAALTATGKPAPWSSHGFWVDCSAVGEGVLSTYVEGQESAELDPHPDTFGPDPWAVWSGTSFAAPQVAGAVARLCREDGLTPHQAVGELLRRGRPLPDFGQALAILPGT